MENKKIQIKLAEQDLNKVRKRLKNKKVYRVTQQVRVSSSSYKKLRELSWASERTMSSVLDDAISWFIRNKPKDY